MGEVGRADFRALQLLHGLILTPVVGKGTKVTQGPHKAPRMAFAAAPGIKRATLNTGKSAALARGLWRDSIQSVRDQSLDLAG